MKKIKLFALAAFAMLSTNASAAELLTKFSGANGVEYQIVKEFTPAAGFNPEVNGQVVVVSYSQSATTDPVVIPATVRNTNNAIAADVPLTNVYDVVGIAGYKDLYYVSGGVGVVKANATDAQVTVFQGCKATSITLPASLQSIGHHAFWGCEATEITIPAQSRLLTIGDAAFMGAKNLATFATSNAGYLANVGADAFYGCTALTEFSATQNLADIGDGAFIGTGITKLDLSSCKLFTTAHTVSISRWFTAAVGNLASYTALDATLKPILYTAAPNYATADAANSKLATVILPTALENGTDVLAIDANAFDGCTALATIGATANTAIIPAYISSIGAGAFLKTNITKFDISANAAITTIGAWFSKKADAPTADPSKLEQVILNSSATTPAAYASFAGLTGISTLAKVGITGAEYALPAATTAAAVAAGVFAGTALTQLDLSKITAAVTPLPALFWAGGTDTNFGITSLTTVVLNNQTVALDANAFAGCTALESLTIKKADGTAVENLTTLATINTAAFWQTKLSSLTFGVSLTTLTTPFKAPATATTDQAKLALTAATSVSIDLSACTALKNGGTTVNIAANTFKGLAKLTSITLPEGLKEIGANAFEGTGLTSIVLPATIDQTAAGLKDNAFMDCKSLATVTFEPATATGTIFEHNGNETGNETKNVFKGCSLVNFATTTEYSELFDESTQTLTVPVNVVMAKAVSKTIKTAMDKKTNGYAMKGFYDTANDYKIPADQVTTVYEAYLDDDEVVLSRLRKKSGYYEIPKGLAVIVRTSEAKEVTPIKHTGTAYTTGSSLLGKYTGYDNGNQLQSVATDKSNKPEANYVYALTNKTGEGFAFSFYTGAKLNNGNIFVISKKKPSASGRLNIVFLDENGNVEDETTAIQSIETENEDAPAYNLAGQKVNASYKGVVIKNGKKYIK